jgi:hypothetical protein
MLNVFGDVKRERADFTPYFEEISSSSLICAGESPICFVIFLNFFFAAFGLSPCTVVEPDFALTPALPFFLLLIYAQTIKNKINIPKTIPVIYMLVELACGRKFFVWRIMGYNIIFLKPRYLSLFRKIPLLQE